MLKQLNMLKLPCLHCGRRFGSLVIRGTLLELYRKLCTAIIRLFCQTVGTFSTLLHLHLQYAHFVRHLWLLVVNASSTVR